MLIGCTSASRGLGGFPMTHSSTGGHDWSKYRTTDFTTCNKSSARTCSNRKSLFLDHDSSNKLASEHPPPGVLLPGFQIPHKFQLWTVLPFLMLALGLTSPHHMRVLRLGVDPRVTDTCVTSLSSCGATGEVVHHWHVWNTAAYVFLGCSTCHRVSCPAMTTHENVRPSPA